MIQPGMGGSFAPPLSDALLAKYKAMVQALAPSPAKDAMAQLLHCCGVWWELPESNGASRPHASGRGTVVNLTEANKAALWDHIPWAHEIEGMKALFETIQPDQQRNLRNAAHHLLWHVIELDLDREPVTTDKL